MSCLAPIDPTMITITPSAAQQIRVAATRSDCDELGLRIAVRRDADGSLHYAMGFDEARNDDIVITSAGIALVVAPSHRELVDGMTLDYVEYETDDFRFIFINPNDTSASGAPEDGGGDGNCGGTGGTP
jgi:iron-sulfur cluster assembly accessory protein